MSDAQYAVLRPFITDRINDLVRGRLLQGVKFFGTTALRSGFDRSEVKLALLLVRIANPKEVLTKQESALIEMPLRQQKLNGSSGEAHLSEKTEIKGTKPKRKKPGV